MNNFYSVFKLNIFLKIKFVNKTTLSIFNNLFLDLFLIIICPALNAQVIYRQHNTPGSEIYADAPYRIKKNQSNGSLNNVPVSFYVHGSNSSIYNNEIAYIDIKVKNASDSSFTHLLTFQNLNSATFNSLFIDASAEDIPFGMQDFWSGKPQRSTQHSIIFTKDVNIWVPPVPYVDIDQPYFYFTFLIPGYSLTGFDDVIDFEICIGLDWATDEFFYLRVNRSSFGFPLVQNWFRGDVHYHGMFTQNDAENGLPLPSTKNAAQHTGLDWITVTDHSCDFDNYGISISDNWDRLGQYINQLNTEDSSFIFVRGLELSVNNSLGKTIHSLIYPDDNSPFGLPYIGDGNGDLTAAAINIDGMVDSLKKYNAFTYAAHPFAEKDELPLPVNGGIWNLNDSLFPLNGNPHPSEGNVICNNISVNSDIYCPDDSLVIKNNIAGFEIWNYMNTLTTDENPYNPWNVTYQNSAAFSYIPITSPIHYLYRLYQGLDAYKAILQRGLIEKNLNTNVKNWKSFISGGSDAHGDFNYSNTNFLSLMGVSYDNIIDNAIGKINTLAYCPNGMGANGSNILKALRNGHTVISSGPVLLMNISENGQQIAVPGNDTLISNYNNCSLNLEVHTNDEFGPVYNVAIVVGSQNGEERIELPYFLSSYSISIANLFNQLQQISIAHNEWFYVRAELETKRMYTLAETHIFKKSQESFHCFTNPIWLKSNIITQFQDESALNNNIKIYPNPAHKFLNIDILNNTAICSIEILSVSGKLVSSFSEISGFNKIIDVSTLDAGLYFVRITTDNQIYMSKFIKK